ncbi:MAG: hypothetical protein HYV27_22100 [Candidatus Hydrogenedentes bacterium]|nr:hypothetical protein [Candidatus Hydrogenedentota bacterium]
MRKLERIRRRRALWGWIKWSPVLFILFSFLFADVWLNIETRRHDYAYIELNSAIREVRKEIKDLKRDRASLETFDQLAQVAPDLGLQEPEPDQIETITFRAEPLLPKEPLSSMITAEAKPAPATAIENRIAAVLGDVAQLQTRSTTVVQWLRDQVKENLPTLSDKVEQALAPAPADEATASVAEAEPESESLDESIPDLLGHL